MKKVLFASAIFVMALSVKTSAQKTNSEGGEFKKFKVDVSLGYALPIGGTGSKGGVLFATEPKYAVTNEISVGLRIEGAVTLSGINAATGYTNGNASVKAAVSYLLTGDYYLSKSSFRPFIGAGAGFFQQQTVIGNSGGGGIMHGELDDVTVSQALDYVVQTFPAFWVYEDCVTKEGARSVYVNVY